MEYKGSKQYFSISFSHDLFWGLEWEIFVLWRKVHARLLYSVSTAWHPSYIQKNKRLLSTLLRNCTQTYARIPHISPAISAASLNFLTSIFVHLFFQWSCPTCGFRNDFPSYLAFSHKQLNMPVKLCHAIFDIYRILTFSPQPAPDDNKEEKKVLDLLRYLMRHRETLSAQKSQFCRTLVREEKIRRIETLGIQHFCNWPYRLFCVYIDTL